jgi:hypothetical protein
MLPIIPLPHTFWRTVRSLLTGVAIPALLTAGLTHSSLSGDIMGILIKAENTVPKEPSIHAHSELPSTSTPSLTLAGNKLRIFEPSLPVKFDPLENYWSNFSLSDLAQANWVQVDGGFSLPIVQQPAGDSMYVSSRVNLLTQFSRPAQNGVTALLAHNYRSGIQFYDLRPGQKITITYGGLITREYRVVSIDKFQKLVSSDTLSDLIDLQTNTRVTSTEVYKRFYSGEPHLTFQTCLEKDGKLDWGLYFVVADPLPK